MKKSIFGLLLALISLSTSFSQNIGKADKAVKKQLAAATAVYFEMKNFMVASNGMAVNEQATSFLAALKKVDVALMTEKQKSFYTPLLALLNEDAGAISKSYDLKAQRERLQGLSNNLMTVIMAFKANSASIYVQYCPMAFNDKGATWLSERKEVKNPYFGDEMLNCGSVKGTF